MERFFEFIGNNLIWASLWVALAVLLLWNIYGNQVMGVAQLETTDVTRKINRDGATVIDLRTESEFKNGHLINAINIPERELDNNDKLLEKYRNTPVILYCQNGQVSPRVVKKLKSDGYTDVTSMKGGISSWQRAGLPLSRSKS